MIKIERHHVAVRHRSIHIHPLLHMRHILHAPHILILDHYDRLSLGTLIGSSNMDHLLIIALRHPTLEELSQDRLILLGHIDLTDRLLVLTHKILQSVTVDTDEVAVLRLLLQHPDQVHVEGTIEQEYAVALILRCTDIAVLTIRILRVEMDHLLVLIGLVALDQGLVLLECVVLLISVLEEQDTLSPLCKFLIRQHTILHEEIECRPLLLKSGTIRLEELRQLVRHLAGDIGRDLLDPGIGLKIAPADVKRDIR